MNHDINAPILIYRDFYDVPRIFIVALHDRLFLMDCEFDNEIEEYNDYFSIYAINNDTYEKSKILKDWRNIHRFGIKIGTIMVDQIEFDHSRKAYINSTVFSFIDQ